MTPQQLLSLAHASQQGDFEAHLDAGRVVPGRGPGRWFRWRQAVGFDVMDGDLVVGRTIASRFPLLGLVPSACAVVAEPGAGCPRWLAGLRAQAEQRRVVAREFFGPLWDEATTFV